MHWDIFLLGFAWFFLLSMQTRIIAFTNNYWLHGVWAFATSIVWSLMVKDMVLTASSTVIFNYALGTALGSITATEVHRRLNKKQLWQDSDHKQLSSAELKRSNNGTNN